MTRAALVVMLAIATGVGCDTRAGAPAPPSTTERPTTRASASAPLEAVERLTGGASPSEPLPMLVALHGLGDRPESFGELYAGLPVKARVVLLRAPDPWGEGYSWFPLRAGESEEALARGIAAAAERVVATLAQLEARHPTRGKPVVTGFSQGGMLSFAIAAQHPERVRAAFPVGGLLPRPLLPAHDAGHPSVRVVALHGEADERVPFAAARAGVEALAARGFDARLEGFPRLGHQFSPTLRARYLELLAEELGRP